MIRHPQADALLAGPLGSWLEGQAEWRDVVRRKAQRRFHIALGVAMAVAFGIVVSGGEIAVAAQLGFFIGLGGFGWMAWTRRPAEVQIKAAINTAIANALGLEFSTQVTDPRPFERARSFELLPAHDQAETEDQWSGALDGQPFCLHEAKLTETRGSGKNRRTVTVFAGILMAVGFARAFTGVTLIRRKSKGIGLLRTLLGRGDAITVNGLSLQRVDLVDPRFDDLFEAWASDRVEGHYLIHPAYVERLIAVEQAFAGDKLRAVFAEGQLLIALESRNLFESGSLEASDDRRLVEQTIGQFGALADLAMQLNERAR